MALAHGVGRVRELAAVWQAASVWKGSRKEGMDVRECARQDVTGLTRLII